MSNESETDTYFDKYAEAAGLRPTDMPNRHHPLLEQDDEVTELSDLIDVRENPSQDSVKVRELERGRDRAIDVDHELTFPHTPGAEVQGGTAEISDFDADARTRAAADDEDDTSYMTRADFEESMNDVDPDPNAGMDADEFLGGAVDEYRAPDITGTVTGIARGMATHLPQDIGAQGFQIEDPEMDGDPSLDADLAAHIDSTRGHTDPTRLRRSDPIPGIDNLNDGERIPTSAPNAASRDDALDATRRIR